MARGENKPYEAAQVWAYIDELRKAAGFESEGQFAIAAEFLPSSISDWKRGKHVLSSTNLVRLIRAAAERLAIAPLEAGEAVSPAVALLRRLAELEAAGAESAEKTAQSLEALTAGIARLEEQLSGEGGQGRKAQTR